MPVMPEHGDLNTPSDLGDAGTSLGPCPEPCSPAEMFRPIGMPLTRSATSELRDLSLMG